MNILHIKSVNIISANGEDIKSVAYLKQLSDRHKCSVLSVSLKANYEMTINLLKKWGNRFTITEQSENSILCLSYQIQLKILFAENTAAIPGIISEYLTENCPDFVFTNFIDTVTLKVVQETAIPYFTFVSDLTFTAHNALTPEKKQVIEKVENIAVLTRYTQKRLRQVLNKKSIILPAPFIPEAVKAENNTREFITLINPVKVKGADLFIRLAAKFPEYLFLGVGGWNEQAVAEYKRQARMLPNLKYLPATDDMRKIYGRTRILLVPSVWEESFGRVCTEAMLNGIPVVTSNCGGLPEAVPYPELNLPPDDMDKWSELLKKLADEHYYNYISGKMAELAGLFLKKQQQALLSFEYNLVELAKR